MTCTTTRRKPARNYQPHVGNLINEFFNTAVGDVIQKSETKNFTNPATNVREYDNRYELSIALPGYDKKDVSITIEDDRLSIKSTMEPSDEKANYRLREWNYEGFQKHFRLAETIDQANVSAAFEQGVLLITLKKKEEAIPQPPKSITIQ